MKKRNFIKNNHALTNTIESLIAIGVTITLVFVFCYSINTQYNAYDNPKINLKTQSEAIAENLINLQGLNKSFCTDWEYYGTTTVNDLNYLGFATNPTIEYGVIDKTTSGIVDGPYPKNYVGQTGTCFLAGTKIVMADGTYKNIETIVVGNTVKSFDEKNRQIEDKKVTKIFHHAPEEMGDYYLVINKILRVTPNHQFYTEKGWITADRLKIDDKLSYSSECNTIYSIEKVYEKVETYNFEVEGNHNYFVTFDSKDILVHNDIPHVGPVEANFTWFDEDGLASQTWVYFKSTNDTNVGSWVWASSTDGEPYIPLGSGSSIRVSIGKRCYVKLTVSSSDHINSLVKIVEANKLNAEPDPDPWVLTGKNANPDTGSGTLSSYGEGYYIMYSDVPGSNYKVYEVKEKKSSGTPILSGAKIEYVKKLIMDDQAKLYSSMKNWSGLTSDKSMYNFHITIYGYNKFGEWAKILDFGASSDNVNDKVSITRQVQIYTPPTAVGKDIKDHPTYLAGEVIVSTFIGGTPPT